MPLFGHSRTSSQVPPNQQQNAPASGLFQATQALGSIGAPAGNLRTATTGTTSAGTDALYQSRTKSSANAAGQPPQTPNHNSSQSVNAVMTSPSANNSNSFESARRPQGYGRPSDELHLESGQRGQGSPGDYGGGAPRIKLDQGTPEHYQRGHLPSNSTGRPLPSSANTVPAVPTLGGNMSNDPFATPLRPQAGSLSHNRSYSRSSPATGQHDGPAYQAYSATTPGGSEVGNQFSTPSSLKYVPGQQRNVSNTPLGLADIRPRADSNLAEGLPGANPYSYDGASAAPTNSNYLAPWAIYAFDWCKWPAHNNDAGKVAVGSYLEDGHNFVSPNRFALSCITF